jgi:hypothetical protein
MSNEPVTSKGAPQTSPRGVDRVRRRTAQAQHAEQAQQEAANLVSPSTPEKEAAIASAKNVDLARFGPSKRTRTKALQQEHKERAEVEATALAGVLADRPLAALVPGQQVDNLTARRMARLNDRQERDTNREAAKAAGQAVFDTLKGRPTRDHHTRQRRIALHNARVARAAAQQ